jgi:methionyl-tRNA formyltransferase
MRLVFLGTPAFAVPSLHALAAAPDMEVAGVLCQPDRPAGRGGELRAPAVKAAAAELGLPVYQPERIKRPEALAWLQAQAPEALVVVAYGQLLPAAVFNLPRWGAINAHASLLPLYRGAAPIQWAIARGETVTGVTTMRIEAGLDTGPMLLRRETPIGPEETATELSARLAALAAELLLATLRGLAAGTVVPAPQPAAGATLAPLLTRADATVHWGAAAREIYNRWRGFQPWPGIATTFRGRRLQILACRPAPAPPGPKQSVGAAPGTLACTGDRLLAACGEGWLQLDAVQLEGRRPAPGADFARGARLQPGDRLGA